MTNAMKYLVFNEKKLGNKKSAVFWLRKIGSGLGYPSNKQSAVFWHETTPAKKIGKTFGTKF